MPFEGFGPQALPFLKALWFYQTKEWFEANRATYESELKGPMGDLVEDLATAFAKAKLPLKGDRKASLFLHLTATCASPRTRTLTRPTSAPL